MSNGTRVLTDTNKQWVVDVVRGEVHMLAKINGNAVNLDDPVAWKAAQARAKTFAARLLAVLSLDSFDAYQEYKKNKGA